MLLVYCYWLFGFVTHDCESHDVWFSHMTHSYESWVSRMWSTLDTWLVIWVMIGLGMLRSWLSRVIWWISHYDSPWVMSRVTRRHESRLREEPLYKGTLQAWVGFFTQPSKLLSLLLVQSTIFIPLPTFLDQSVLSNNDPP